MSRCWFQRVVLTTKRDDLFLHLLPRHFGNSIAIQSRAIHGLTCLNHVVTAYHFDSISRLLQISDSLRQANIDASRLEIAPRVSDGGKLYTGGNHIVALTPVESARQPAHAFGRRGSKGYAIRAHIPETSHLDSTRLADPVDLASPLFSTAFQAGEILIDIRLCAKPRGLSASAQMGDSVQSNEGIG